MKQQTIRIIACFCLISLLLTGCGKQETGPGAMGSEVWKEMPKLTYGVLESESLEVLSWNNGRLEATSRNRMAETENGYYLVNAPYIYYADKKDLDNWFPVCNKPDCHHDSKDEQNRECNAFLDASFIVINNNRLFYDTDSRQYPHLNVYKDSGLFLMSMAADGTDKQVAYTLEEAAFSGEGMYSSFLTSKNWVYYADYMGKDGKMIRNLYRVTNKGVEVFPARTDILENDVGYISYFPYGDEAYYCNTLGNSEYGLFRFADGELVETECAGLELDGAYLSGNTLRIFRPNDGYYDVNLTTREEVFLAPAQLKNSSASIILPNCMIETTLFDRSLYQDKKREMKLFDGETWRTVELPEELAESVNAYKTAFPTFSITSDGVFLYCSKDGIKQLYRIPLTTGELKAEYCCEIG